MRREMRWRVQKQACTSLHELALCFRPDRVGRFVLVCIEGHSRKNAELVWHSSGKLHTLEAGHPTGVEIEVLRVSGFADRELVLLHIWGT
eukprot:1160396-Pelagomonas_calceolata.AAC.10